MSERLTTADLVTRAKALATGPDRALLGITGPPGAGKSTLARVLADALGADAAVVAMDGFHLSQRVLTELGRQDRKGAIDTFDDGGYAALVERLTARDEAVVYAPVFRREIEEPVAAGVAVPAEVPLVITEGNYLLAVKGAWPRARAHLTEVWYLEVPREARLERLVARHHTFGKALADAHAWANGSDEHNAELIAATRDDADLVVEWV